MSTESLPLWVTIPGSVLLVVGGLMTVAGSVGLLRFPNFFARMHGLALGNSAGVGSILLTSMLASSAFAGRPMLHELLIAALVIATAPMMSILLLQAALYRNRARQASGPSAPDKAAP